MIQSTNISNYSLGKRQAANFKKSQKKLITPEITGLKSETHELFFTRGSTFPNILTSAKSKKKPDDSEGRDLVSLGLKIEYEGEAMEDKKELVQEMIAKVLK